MAVYAEAETTVAGNRSGTMSATISTDDQYESITEVLSSGGNPASRYSFLEHRWSFTVPPHSSVALHVEGFDGVSADGDDFVFEWSTDGASWNPAPLPVPLPPVDAHEDLSVTLSLPAGPVEIRVVDTNRSSGGQDLDTVSIDEIFLRVLP